MSTNSSSITDPRALRAGSIVKWIILILGFAILGPIIWLAIGGLIGFCIFVVIALGAWMLRKPAFVWAANYRLKMIKSVVAKNPVETLQEEERLQTIQLNVRKQAIQEMGGAIRTLDEAIDSLEKEFPDSAELPQMREDQQELVKLMKAREDDWKQAYVALGDFGREIKRVGKLWDVSQAAARARQSTGVTEDEWMSKMKTETAIDSIRTHLNTQLSALNTERMQSDAQRILKGRQQAQRTAGTSVPPALPSK